VKAAVALNAGIVDQDVDRSGFVLDPLDEGGDLRRAHVGVSHVNIEAFAHFTLETP
jgi:hypothetical protein